MCVGNLCRSPVAEALFARDLPGWQVYSAGLAAKPGDPADTTTQVVAGRHGLDLSGHRAQAVNALLCQQAEVILVMERLHKQALERQYPAVRGKVYRLGEWGGFDIRDPYQQPTEVHETTFAAIAQGVEAWLPRLRSL